MTASITEESIELLVNDQDEVSCEAQWGPGQPECGSPAEWRATVHNSECEMEAANFCGSCMSMIKLASLLSRCSLCHSRDLLRDVRRI